MFAVEVGEPDVTVHAVQWVGGFTFQGDRWPAGSWIVHVPGLPAHRWAIRDDDFRGRFTLLHPRDIAAAA